MVVKLLGAMSLALLVGCGADNIGTLPDAAGAPSAGGSSGGPNGGADSGGNEQAGGVGGSVIGGSGGSPTGGSGGSSSGGTAGAAARCDGPPVFGPLVPVPGLDSAEIESGARFTSDELTVIFARGVGIQTDLFMAARASRDAAFGPAEPLALNQPGDGNCEVRPWISDDRLTILFDRVPDPEAAPSTGTWMPRIAARLFDGAGFLPEDESEFPIEGDGSPYVIADSTGTGTVYFRADGVVQQSLVNWIPTGDTNLVADRFRPVLTRDELTLFSGQGVYVSQRASRDEAFGAPTQLFEAESPTWISPDGCRLYVEHEGDIQMSLRDP